MVIPARYQFACSFSEGLACAAPSEGSGFGFIDLQGRSVIDINPRFETVGDFSEGLGWFRMENNDVGYIDLAGKVQIQRSRGETLYDFEGGFAIVMTPDDEWGYIDRSGKWIWRPTK